MDLYCHEKVDFDKLEKDPKGTIKGDVLMLNPYRRNWDTEDVVVKIRHQTLELNRQLQERRRHVEENGKENSVMFKNKNVVKLSKKKPMSEFYDKNF